MNFDFYGLTVTNGRFEIETISMSLISRKWVCSIKMYNGEIELPVRERIEFDYAEGLDPISQAEEIISNKYN